jgi:membrane protease YdiL (CAAX protease family)
MSLLLVPTPHARIRPRWWVGVAFFVVFQIVVFSFVPSLTREPLGATSATLGRVVGPIGICLAAAVILMVALGLWRPVLFEARRTSRRWLAFPAALLLGPLLLLAVDRFQSHAHGDPLYLLATIVFVLAAAASEELTFRGILLTGFRESGWPEWAAYVASTVLFAVIHLDNVFSGIGLSEVITQTLSALFLGSALYLVRRASGNLLVPIALHATYNLSILGATASGVASPLGQVGGILIQAALVLSIPLVVLLLILEARRARRSTP